MSYLNNLAPFLYIAPTKYVQLCLSGQQPVFLNGYGAQESIPRNEFRLPM
jgi:hypothetical protein